MSKSLYTDPFLGTPSYQPSLFHAVPTLTYRTSPARTKAVGGCSTSLGLFQKPQKSPKNEPMVLLIDVMTAIHVSALFRLLLLRHVPHASNLAEPKASPRGGGRFSPGDSGGKGVSPRLNGGGMALGRSSAAGGRGAEGKPSNARRWKVGIVA